MSVDNNIPKGWVETTLGEVVTTNDNSIGKDFKYAELEYLDTGSITTNQIDKYQIFKVNEAPSRAKRLVQDGDIVYSTVRPNQKHYGFIKKTKNNLVVSTGFTVIRAKEISYSKFIFYWLTQNSVTAYLHQLAEQSTSAYPSIKPIDIENLPITIPQDIKEQVAIAKILTAFDDKIENLQAQNKTLETTAQTIFKEWFGKYQIGDDLPEGWRVGKLGDFNATIVDFVANGSFASLKENVTLSEIKEYALFIRNTDLKSNFKEKRYVDKKSYEFLSKTKLYGGEIIISNVGDVGSVHFCPYFEIPMTLGNNVIMLRSNYQYYFYTMFKSRIGRHLIDSITGGSAQPKFNKTDFRNMGMVIPKEDLLDNFEATASKLYIKIEKNNTQIQTLKKTRDTLLPKLMSGQLRVKM
jgi:type I restriction enzyme S subunit